MWMVEEWGVDRFREMIEEQMGDKLAKGVRCSFILRLMMSRISCDAGLAAGALQMVATQSVRSGMDALPAT